MARNVIRYWPLIIGISIIGALVMILVRQRIQLDYQAEGIFRITFELPAPKLDNNIQIYRDEAIEPASLAVILLEEALNEKSIMQLFSKHPSLFADEARDQGKNFLTYVRKYAKIIPLAETHYRVIAQARNPNQAQELVQWILNASVANYKRLTRERIDTLASFTKSQSNQAARDLARQEEKMLSFLRKNPALIVRTMEQDARLSASGPDRLRLQSTQRIFNLAGASIAKHDPLLTALIEERNRLQSERRAMDNVGQATSTSGMAKLSELQEARRRLHEMYAQGLGAQHPEVKQAQRKVASLENEVQKIAPGQGTATSKYASKMQTHLKDLDRKIKSRLGSNKNLLRLETQWGAMVREQRLLLQRYDSLNRLAQALMFNTRLSDHEADQLAAVIDLPVTPLSPHGVKGWMILVAGFFTSIIIGFGVALLLGGIENRLFYSDDVGNLLHLPLLSALPPRNKKKRSRSNLREPMTNDLIGWSKINDEIEVSFKIQTSPESSAVASVSEDVQPSNAPAVQQNALVHLPADLRMNKQLMKWNQLKVRICTVAIIPPTTPALFLIHDSQGECANQMRVMATRIQEGGESGSKVILVASWENKEGRTITAANLAMALAESRRRTLLIDLGGGASTLTRLFGLSLNDQYSLNWQLSMHLSGQEAPIVIFKIAESLAIIPSGLRRAPMSPLLSSEVLSNFLDYVCSYFDVIIFDTLPMKDSPNTVVLDKIASGLLLVVRNGLSTLSGVTSAIGQVNEDKLLGVIFNQYEMPRKNWWK